MSADFSVVALIAAYNEADIVEQVVSHLISQGIQVYFLDDSSTDGTVAAVEPYVGRGLVAIEHLAGATAGAAPEGSGGFDWERILRRKAEIATRLDATWFIHHDADEFRESPWPHLSLNDAIRHVDALGYNAIDFAGLDFWPVDDRFHAGDDVREAFTFCSELAPHDLPQVRCWKKTDGLDLTSSGGHEARFAGRRVFPLRFLLRHYPIRGQAHGDRKVFTERRNRFLDRERVKGWHVQYDQMREGTSFLRDPATLAPYDPDAARRSLTLHPRYPEELEEALSALRGELEARSAQIARGNQALQQRDADIERWRAAVDGLTRRLDELQRSLSWRWTAPARAVYRIVKGS